MEVTQGAVKLHLPGGNGRSVKNLVLVPVGLKANEFLRLNRKVKAKVFQFIMAYLPISYSCIAYGIINYQVFDHYLPRVKVYAVCKAIFGIQIDYPAFGPHQLKLTCKQRS